MNLTIRTIGIVLALCSMASCAKIFSTPDAAVLAHKHQTVAIVPPKVAIAARKKVDAQAIQDQQRAESMNFQREMYSWLLKRKMQGKISPEIQDVETTNTLLRKAGYPDTPISPGELCEILGVDGVITSNYAISKPMSEGGAVALGLLLVSGAQRMKLMCQWISMMVQTGSSSGTIVTGTQVALAVAPEDWSTASCEMQVRRCPIFTAVFSVS
jgi:hypothetical protein